MTTAAQRERTQLRTKLYTGCMIPGSHGRGGARIPESSRDAARPGLVQLWPAYLDKERAAAKPTLTLVGVKAMLEEEQTPAFKAFAPRRLSGGEVAVIRAWYEKAQQQEKKDLGDAVAAAQGNIMGQAAANHDEVMEKLRGHNEILQRLDNQTKSGSQLQREATKRKQEELRDKYQAVLQSVGRALPEEPLQPLAEYRNRLRDPVLRTALAEKAAAANAQPGADGEAAGESEAPPQRSRSMSPPASAPATPSTRLQLGEVYREQVLGKAGAEVPSPVGSKSPRPCHCDEASAPDSPHGRTREQLAPKIRAGHRHKGVEGALTAQQAQSFLKWTEEQLANDHPYTVTMTGRSIQKLHHLKLMLGIADEHELLPIYNFGLTRDTWKRVAPMPDFLQDRAKEIGREFGVDTPNNCLINIYRGGSDYIAPHQDQAFSTCGGKYESELPVIIDRVGAARDLVFHDLSGAEIDRICLQAGDSYILPGPLNILVKHSVPPCEESGLCVTFSWRCVRNRVSPDGKFAVVNEKRMFLCPLARALEKEANTKLTAMCEEYKVDATGNKTDLIQRLSDLPAEPRQQLEIAVLARGHTSGLPMATRALKVQGPELAENMLTGGKVVENRSEQIGLGWWVVVVGVDRKWREAEWAKPFKAVIDTLPTDEGLASYYGHAVGLIYLSKYRTQGECNGYKWAGRDCVCHVVSHAVKFKAPIKINPPKMKQSPKWNIEPDEEPRIRAQFPDGPPVAHDLRPINAAEEEPALEVAANSASAAGVEEAGGSSPKRAGTSGDASLTGASEDNVTASSTTASSAAEPDQTEQPAGADELEAAPLKVLDTVKILAGPCAGEEGIVSEVKGDKSEVDEVWYSRSELEKLF